MYRDGSKAVLNFPSEDYTEIRRLAGEISSRVTLPSTQLATPPRTITLGSNRSSKACLVSSASKSTSSCHQGISELLHARYAFASIPCAMKVNCSTWTCLLHPTGLHTPCVGVLVWRVQILRKLSANRWSQYYGWRHKLPVPQGSLPAMPESACTETQVTGCKRAVSPAVVPARLIRHENHGYLVYNDWLL